MSKASDRKAQVWHKSS